jgi:acyl carrier protein
MTSEEQSAKIRQTVSDVLGVPLKDITDDTSPDTVEGWDSVAHLNLIMALEENLGMGFTPEETMDMTSVKLIRLVVEEKRA